MTSHPIPARAAPNIALWGVLFLLVISVSINYIDRGNLSIAAPLLKDELAISPQRLGILLWVPLWFKWMPRGYVAPQAEVGVAPGIPDILRRHAAWATFTGHFCGNYFWYFLLTWLPFYLVRERHFSMEAMASLGAL